MSRLLNVAVVGASGLVGETIVQLLEERDFPVGEIFLLGSDHSASQPLVFRGKNIRVGNLSDFDFSKVELAFFAVPADIALAMVPIATEQGVVVIDCSSAFRLDDAVPLVAAGVSDEQIESFRQKNIIASPGVLSLLLAQLVAVLKSIAEVSQITVSSYQSASMCGREGIEALAKQSARLMNAQEVDLSVFPQQMAFNVLPLSGQLLGNGYTDNELRAVAELRKVLADPFLPVNVTAVQVPTFHGCSLSAAFTMTQPALESEVMAMLETRPVFVVQDESNKEDVATAVTHATGQDHIYISRIRQDLEQTGVINLWAVADNVRFAGALNSVQIGEMLIKDYL